ncbi:MAG: RDD family protein [Raineya sp.]|nr:RDD family protein [Raineya sp.]
MEKYNTLSPRIIASFIDGICLTIIYLILAGIDLFTQGKLNTYLIFVFFQFWYFIKSHYSSGQTIGKKLAKIKVVAFTDENRLLTFKESFMREFVPIVSYIIQLLLIFTNFYSKNTENLFDIFFWAYFLLDFIVMLSNDKKRSIHDFLANSVVVKVNSEVN